MFPVPQHYVWLRQLKHETNMFAERYLVFQQVLTQSYAYGNTCCFQWRPDENIQKTWSGSTVSAGAEK